MKVRALLISALVATLSAPGCGGSDPEPLELVGEWAFFVTFGDNGCNFAGWTEGATMRNVPVAITQLGDNVIATLDGELGTFLDQQSDNREFAGEAGVDSIELAMEGNRFLLEGNCTYRYNGEISAEVTGDFISGEIRYVISTNDNPGCELIEGCVSSQAFNATLPPRGVDPPADAGPDAAPDAN